MSWPVFERVVKHQLKALVRGAVEDGLVAAALVDRSGHVVAFAGKISDDEVRPLVAFVLARLASEDLASRVLSGEVVSLPIEDRVIAVTIAARQLFVVAVLEAATPALYDRVDQLRGDVARILLGEMRAPPWGRGGGGSGSGPAELPVIELGITVPRRGKA